MNKLLLFVFSFITVSFNTAAQINTESGSDNTDCRSSILLFNKYLSQENYTAAIVPWRTAFTNCPASDKQIYTAGIAIYRHQLKEEKSAASGSKLLDTLIMIYDQQIKYFGEEGLVTADKALSIYEFDKSRTAQINSLLKKSVGLTGTRTAPEVLYTWFLVNTELLAQKKNTIGNVIDVYVKSSELTDANLKGLQSADYIRYKTKTDSLFNTCISCDDLINVYAPQLKKSPDDLRLLKEIVRLFDKKSCNDAAIYEESAMKLHNMEPTPEIAIILAHIYIAKGQSAKATNYFNEAVDLASDNETKATIYIELASFNMNNLKNFPQAKMYAQRASFLRPDWAVPFVLMGDIYAAGAASCNDVFKGSSAYWVSTDQYLKAQSVDPSLSELIHKKVAQNSTHYPTLQEISAKELKPGESFTVKCWINEKTIIRAK